MTAGLWRWLFGSGDEMSIYGYCPKCGAEATTRERRPNGNDTCKKGCVFPSAMTMTAAQLAAKQEAEFEAKKRDSMYVDYHASFSSGYL